MLSSIIKFFIENKLVAWILLALSVVFGLVNAPFDFNIDFLPRDPVSVDAIPDIGENQQIIFTEWAGRSPQDVEDQVTYPLASSLLGLPGVKNIRSNSMFGFSSIYVIFEEDIEFYWSRSRILEKLNSLPANTLPENVKPALGPDATGLGQIYWYTLEGQDKNGENTGGWDLHELRSIQDYIVRYALASAEGVSEVASVGGHVKEYQVDVDPDKMRIFDINIQQIMRALKESNLDIGAQTMEINLAEYFVRGLGYIQNISDIENSVVKIEDEVPILVKDVARVNIGPASRRGILDKAGTEAVGGVVVARYGANPMEVINNVKSKIAEVETGLPSKILKDGTFSQVKIVPFYDRSNLIKETIGTLEEALTFEIIITIIVVILLLLNLQSSLLIASTLPIAVLMCFTAMKYTGVDANIVALSGIAIAIGTMVDMGIVLTESIMKHLSENKTKQSTNKVIYNATMEVAPAVLTAVATTIVSFLPVFTMEAAEGKLFGPLAYTKTYALIAAIIVSLLILPPLAAKVFQFRNGTWRRQLIFATLLTIAGVALLKIGYLTFAFAALLVGILNLIAYYLKVYSSASVLKKFQVGQNVLYALSVIYILSKLWMPLNSPSSLFENFIFIGLIVGMLIVTFHLLIHFYEHILRFILKIKYLFLLGICGIVFWGFSIFSEIGEEFMPALDEGSFLLMPTTMPHAGMQVNVANLRLLDLAVNAIPEVETVVGKAGRVESSLDPAPMSMYENVILYKTEFKTDEQGRRQRFKVNEEGAFLRDEQGALIADEQGNYFRQWRDHIKRPDDIWDEIVKATKIPGLTSAPKLQPIETRLVMLQTGMRSPMGVKVKGTNLAQIESFGFEIEKHLKNVQGVKAPAVFAERIVGKPYLMIDLDRNAINRYGLTIAQIQEQIQASIGGKILTHTVEGRERYGVRIRYPRELRDDPEKLSNIYVSTPNGKQIPLGDVVDIRYEQGPQSIKSEDGFLVGYVLFDKLDGEAEVNVVENAKQYLAEKIESGELIVPAGISYKFAGNFEQQVRANKKLALVIPLALMIILLILYFQFSSLGISLMVFSGVFVAFSGGFIMMWLYGQSWFLDFQVFETNMRDLFQIKPINLSIAVWVGFLALFGIATDDGVLVATFIRDSFKKNQPKSRIEIQKAVVEGGLRRVRPAMMTTATTILALLPILTATGRGADIMIPMAIPSFGGMLLQIVTIFTVPVLYTIWKENELRFKKMRG